MGFYPLEDTRANAETGDTVYDYVRGQVVANPPGRDLVVDFPEQESAMFPGVISPADHKCLVISPHGSVYVINRDRLLTGKALAAYKDKGKGKSKKGMAISNGIAKARSRKRK